METTRRRFASVSACLALISPRSSRLARDTSCLAVRRLTRPISLRYMRTGSLVDTPVPPSVGGCSTLDLAFAPFLPPSPPPLESASSAKRIPSFSKLAYRDSTCFVDRSCAARTRLISAAVTYPRSLPRSTRLSSPSMPIAPSSVKEDQPLVPLLSSNLPGVTRLSAAAIQFRVSDDRPGAPILLHCRLQTTTYDHIRAYAQPEVSGLGPFP